MDKDTVVFSTCRARHTWFYRLLYAPHQPGGRNERGCSCVQRDVIFIDMLQYIPLIAGILMAIVQFVPEMQRKCLKLTLHLPYPELKMTGNMLLSGLVLLLVCFASNFLLMEVYLNGILAHD